MIFLGKVTWSYSSPCRTSTFHFLPFTMACWVRLRGWLPSSCQRSRLQPCLLTFPFLLLPQFIPKSQVSIFNSSNPHPQSVPGTPKETMERIQSLCWTVVYGIVLNKGGSTALWGHPDRHTPLWVSPNPPCSLTLWQFIADLYVICIQNATLVHYPFKIHLLMFQRQASESQYQIYGSLCNPSSAPWGVYIIL